MAKFTVEVYLTHTDKYNGTFNFNCPMEAAKKAIGNVYAGSKTLTDVLSDMVTEKELLYWCDRNNGSYARIIHTTD